MFSVAVFVLLAVLAVIGGLASRRRSRDGEEDYLTAAAWDDEDEELDIADALDEERAFFDRPWDEPEEWG